MPSHTTANALNTWGLPPTTANIGLNSLSTDFQDHSHLFLQDDPVSTSYSVDAGALSAVTPPTPVDCNVAVGGHTGGERGVVVDPSRMESDGTAQAEDIVRTFEGTDDGTNESALLGLDHGVKYDAVSHVGKSSPKVAKTRVPDANSEGDALPNYDALPDLSFD